MMQLITRNIWDKLQRFREEHIKASAYINIPQPFFDIYPQ